MLNNAGLMGTWIQWPATVLQGIPPFVLVPRFILGLRELYAHHLQGSLIDTAFGVGSGPTHGLHGAVRSTMAFAAPGENEDDEVSNEIQMEGIQEVHRMSSRV